ncbi:MAG: mechanosensitive ion channel protein [Candidatus Marinimicrobia bacterium]|nr:mechanosensitive ion channel protein [Candidatus Neomarinimicrobiota bacterium]|tara:strand:+ start:14803 stop:15858 length:1056 start_codon:yes stop_codon:yes gene_type:complete
METIELILEFIAKYEVLLFLIYLLLSFIIAAIIDQIFIITLKKFVSKSKTNLDDKLIDTLHPALYNTILYIGFYIAINSLTLPAKIQFLFNGMIKSFLVIYWSLGLFKSFIIIINWISNKDNKNALIKKKTLPLFDNVGKIVIFLFSIYFIMLSWGINVTAWIASAGILSVVIGFAAKDTLGNLFAGIFIMADSPYKEGDYINLDTGERGYVRDIGIRSTRIQTRDDIEITIPNSVIANSKIVNESGGTHEKERIRISVDVAYGTVVNDVKNIMNTIAKSSSNVCKEPAPRVRFREFGASGLKFQLLAWIEKPELRGRVVDELSTEIYNAFNAENIEIPFPQRTVHIKKTD